MENAIIRPTISEDLDAVVSLCQELLQDSPAAARLLETSLLSLTAVDKQRNVVLGFLCLQDEAHPRHGTCKATAAELVSQFEEHNRPSVKAAFAAAYAVAPQHEAHLAPMLFRKAFTLLPLVKNIYIAQDAGTVTAAAEPGLASLATPVLAKKSGPVDLLQISRHDLLPPLTLRPAREEDHDDMLPILQQAEGRFPALAKLPESSRPDEPFALTRVISSQDENNVVLVAHDNAQGAAGNARSKACMAGFMVLTSEVEVSGLMDVFDLHPYDNFLPQEAYEQQWQAAYETIKTRRRNTLEAKLGSRVKTQHDSSMNTDPEQEDVIHPGADAEQDLPTVSNTVDDEAQLTHDVDGDTEGLPQEPGRADASEQIDISAAVEPSDDEVRAEMAVQCDMMMGSDVQPTVFAITMSCMDKQYDNNAHVLDFLRQAFESFPDKQYCLLTLPHDSPEPALVSSFTRLDPVPGAAFPEVLYLFNRHALIDQLDVRLAEAGDVQGVADLISGMPNSGDIRELFMAALDRGTAVVLTAQCEIVGVLTISTAVDVSLLETHFAVSSVMLLSEQPADTHGEVDLVCINPIFAHQSRSFLAAAQRLLKKRVLYYALPPGHPPPDVLDIFRQVPPRMSAAAASSQGPDGEQDGAIEFALYCLARRHVFAKRRAVNARILFVGASETALSALQAMLVNEDLQFNYMTMLAPGGIPVGTLGTQFTAGVLAKLGIDAHVRLVDAEMIALDTESKVIALSDGHQVAYDLLVVVAGLQEPTCTDLAAQDPDAGNAMLTCQELVNGLSMSDAAVMQSVLVYGHTLDTFHALAGLEAKGAYNKAVMYAPKNTQPDAMLGVLRECAQHIRLDLMEPTGGVLTGMKPDEAHSRMVAIMQHPESGLNTEIPADIAVGCQPMRPPRNVFHCLNNAGVVFDGRVVVDHCFRTSDPNIYAAGTIAKLSRRYGKNVNFEQYNSIEVGNALATSLVKAFQGMHQLPTDLSIGSTAAKAVACSVPGGYTFVFTGCPRAMGTPGLVAPEGGMALLTASERGFMQVTLDADGCVYSVAYLGKGSMSPVKLSHLIGLHYNYLNKAVDKYDAKEIKCLITHLTLDPWCALIFNENFPLLRQQVLHGCTDRVSEGKTWDTALTAAHESMLKFASPAMFKVAGSPRLKAVA